MNGVYGALLVLAVLETLAVGFWALLMMRAAWCDWRERLAARRQFVFEAEAIAEIAARVRDEMPAGVPPITAEWLAECVSEACEQSKDMGLS